MYLYSINDGHEIANHNMMDWSYKEYTIEEFEFEAAKEVSQQTAARAERVRKAQEANIAPIAPVPQQNDAGVIDV